METDLTQLVDVLRSFPRNSTVLGTATVSELLCVPI